MEHFFQDHERAMLIRYCTRFTHDWSLAEDLTQQALLEAWLKSDQLYSQDVRVAWLIGIARNICLRWVRRQRQEQAHLACMSDLSSEAETALEDDVDLEEDVERQELAQLLEKALARLLPQMHTVLVYYYLEAMPQAEIAAHLGITTGAVEARLRRGKHTLRHLLTHEWREEASSYGLVTDGLAAWQQTHIWCPVCGQRQLLIQLPEAPGTIAFRCPSCDDDPQGIGWAYPLSNTRFVQYRASLSQPKSILRRFTSWAYDYYSTAVSHQGFVACAQCGQKRRLRLLLPAHYTEFPGDRTGRYGLSGHCPSCDWQDFCSPAGFLQSLPAVQRFWQAHPQMRLVFREQMMEAAGKPAVVASFESVTDAAHLDIVFAQDTLQLIAVHTGSIL